jgi:hypothetical protein
VLKKPAQLVEQPIRTHPAETYDYANQQVEALMAPPNDGDFNPMASVEQRRKDAEHKATLIADYKHIRAASRTQIELARQNQATLTYAYPALAAVQDEYGNNPKDIQTVQARIPQEFDGMRGQMDQLGSTLAKDPSVALLFDPVVAAQLQDKSLSPQQRKELTGWLQSEQENKLKAQQLGSLVSGGLFIASFVPLVQDAAIPLRLAGMGLGGGIAASEIPDLMVLDAAAQAGKGGAGRFTNQSPEQTKFNLVMGYTNVGLAGLDAGLEVGAVQKLAGMTGKLAMSGVQVSRQQWTQVMVWMRFGPEGVENAKAFLASVKGMPKEKAAEALQIIKNGFSPEVETVGVPGQSSMKTAEENVKDAKALQSKGSGRGEYKKPKIIADLEKLPNAKFFASNQLEHVIFGNQNKAGKFTGWHHFPSRLPGEKVRITELNSLGKDVNGVYQAGVEASYDGGKTWIQKTAKDHTFFPNEWSREKVTNEIASAYKSGREMPQAGDAPNLFRGRSESGVLIEGYFDSNGEIKTAYPLYGR